MNILIVNDDGFSEGFVTLMQSIKSHPVYKDANVIAVLPDRNRSGSGASITVGMDVTLKYQQSLVAPELYLCSGTPVDCVHLGGKLFADCELKPDLVISGVNLGPNLADDWIYSGTICAALEANRIGIQSMAISYCSNEQSIVDNRKYAIDVLHKIFDFEVIEPFMGSVYSFNIPDLNLFKEPNIIFTFPGKRNHTFYITESPKNDTFKIGPIGYFMPTNYDKEDFKIVAQGDVSLSVFNY